MLKINEKVMENYFGLMESVIKDTGKIMLNMDMGFSHLKGEQNKKASGKMERSFKIKIDMKLYLCINNLTPVSKK